MLIEGYKVINNFCEINVMQTDEPPDYCLITCIGILLKQ